MTIKQRAPMSWQCLSTVNDGALFLAWVPPRTADVFASDGYLWSGPEERLLQEFGGYVCPKL